MVGDYPVLPAYEIPGEKPQILLSDGGSDAFDRVSLMSYTNIKLKL